MAANRDKWKHMTWWNCWNSNSTNDSCHDNQLVTNGCIYLQGHQSNFKAARWAEAQVRGGEVTLHFRPCLTYSDFYWTESSHFLWRAQRSNEKHNAISIYKEQRPIRKGFNRQGPDWKSCSNSVKAVNNVQKVAPLVWRCTRDVSFAPAFT